MPADPRHFTVAADDDGIRLDRWFKRHLPEANFNIVSRWARTGQLRIDGEKATPGDRLSEGQTLTVPPADAAPPATMAAAPVRRELTPEDIAFAQSLVIHRDEHAIVLDKPPGLATQGGTGITISVDALLGALMFERQDRPKLVHRLDKDTSGVLLIARSARAAGHFAKAFSARTARKVYWALVNGVPSPEHGIIDLPISKQPGSGGEKMHVDQSGEGLAAKTRYRSLERAGNRAVWLEMQPATGRTHQLRVHAAAIGHPIVGDAKYGGRDAFLTGGISRKLHLHARRIVIDQPLGGVLDITAEPPSHMAESFEMLAFDLASGDIPLDPIRFIDTPEGKFKAESAAAKSRRKERKGERRTRRRA